MSPDKKQRPLEDDLFEEKYLAEDEEFENLLNIYIETVGQNSIKLVATDLDMTIVTTVDAQVEEEGKITLPAKKLGDIMHIMW